MPKLQSITHTWYPDSDTPVRYLNGMPKPEPRDMAPIMKLAVFNEVRPGGIAYCELPELERIKRQLRIANS